MSGHIGRTQQVANGIQATPFAVHHDVWTPPTDVYETETEFIIKVDIAGVEDGNMEVTYQDGLLLVRGYRTDCSAFNKQAIHRMEINCGEFVTYVHLPRAVDPDAEIGCTYLSGMLTVTLVKDVAHKVQISAE